MSAAALAWLVADLAAAVVAVVQLLRASGRPDPGARNGYRWLAVVAGCLGGGAAAQLAFGGLIGGSQPLRVADLIALAALPAFVIGLATLTAELGADDRGASVPSWWLRSGRGRPVFGRAAIGIALDSCLLVAALFVICFATVFGPDYATAAAAGVGPAGFVVDLLRPAADLVVLGLLLRFATRSRRLTLLPVLALAAVTIGDCLAVGARISGAVPGVGSRLAVLAALGLLAAAPAAAAAAVGAAAPAALVEAPAEARQRGPISSPATLIALAAAALAAVVVTAVSIGGGPMAAPALAVSGAAMVLLLVTRLAGIARQAASAAGTAQDPDRLFRALAESTIDAVVLCDVTGTVEYASRSVADFGYQPHELIGTSLADLVHPEDRLAAVGAALAALRLAETGGEPVSQPAFAGRVRGADGSWRYVESSMSRYGEPGERVRLMVTARDVSDRVALRRQVAHLTFHDGLTGLPNRAYVEQRLRDLCQAATETGPAGQGLGIGAIVLDLDGYASVNDLVGRPGGDLILAQAGRRLRAAAPPDATVARWGSDAFAVLVGQPGTAPELMDLARLMAARIGAEPFSAAGKEISLTASVGVAHGGLEPAQSPDEVLSNAHLAMTRAKEAGGGQVEIFVPPLPARAAPADH